MFERKKERNIDWVGHKLTPARYICVMVKAREGSNIIIKQFKWASSTIRMSYFSLNGLFPVILMIHISLLFARRDKYLFK